MIKAETKKFFILDSKGSVYRAEIFCEEKNKYWEVWKVLHETVPENFPVEVENLTFIKDRTGWYLNILEEDRDGNIIREESIKLPGRTVKNEYITFEEEEIAAQKDDKNGK